jgi:formate dehydrogenase subunit delta
MDTENLVHMANRIGEFFEAMPDGAQARLEIAQHLRRFWEPRMRRALLAHVDDGAAGLTPIVRDAVVEHRSSLQPAAAA